MIKFHPDANMLVEYANGSLPWALSIAVSAHLQLCSNCQTEYSQLCAIGGAYLNSAPNEPVCDDSFDRLMARIESKPASQIVIKQQRSSSADVDMPLPKVIKKLLPEKLNWRRVSGSVTTARLVTGQTDFEVAFHKICKGGKVIEHDHKGIEVTLVLDGSFSDENGVYKRGDFIVKEPGQIHRPTATQNQDCLCLSVCEAPINVTGFIGKIINPFLSIRPA